MDITKAKAAVSNARGEIKKLTDATVVAGQKDARQFNGLRSLANADAALARAEEKLDDAVARVTPKAKTEGKKKGEKK